MLDNTVERYSSFTKFLESEDGKRWLAATAFPKKPKEYKAVIRRAPWTPTEEDEFF